jgi:ferritin-like protein
MNDHVLQFFEFAHLPEALRDISRPFHTMAHELVSKLPQNPERTKMLNKLLEAKDCAVRAFIAKPVAR